MQEKRIISADSHVREPTDLWSRILGNTLGDKTPREVNGHAGLKGRFFFNGGRVSKLGGTAGMDAAALPDDERFIVEAGYLPEVRIQFQQRAGIETEVLYPSLMAQVMTAPDPAVAQACAQVYNDWIREFTSADPQRLVGVGAVPAHEPDWALKEVRRCRQLGLRAVLVNVVPPEGTPPYRSEEWAPFWAACEELGMPVVLHIVTGVVVDPILYYHTNEEFSEAPKAMLRVWNEIGETLANEFIFGGILDRFPNLVVICAEYEVSWLPHFMYRLDQMQADFTEYMNLPKIKMRASDYLRSRVWHGIIDDRFALDAIRHVGADQILWGSDFPHVRSIGLETQSAVGQLLGALPQEDRDKIVADNMARLLGR